MFFFKLSERFYHYFQGHLEDMLLQSSCSHDEFYLELSSGVHVRFYRMELGKVRINEGVAQEVGVPVVFQTNSDCRWVLEIYSSELGDVRSIDDASDFMRFSFIEKLFDAELAFQKSEKYTKVAILVPYYSKYFAAKVLDLILLIGEKKAPNSS